MKLVRATILMAVHDEQWFEPPDQQSPRASAIFGLLEDDAEGAEIVHLADIEIVDVAVPDPEVDWDFDLLPDPAEPQAQEPDPYAEWQLKAEQEFVRLGWRRPDEEEEE